ncbi:MAG: 4'-phosphopantetheinyl transferase family protein [Lutibacter sp.]
MPLYKTIHINQNTTIYIWKIVESLAQLKDGILLKENSLNRIESMKSLTHKKGFLSIRQLLKQANLSDNDLYYNDLGKPFLNNEKHISITHSFEFSAIIISDDLVGIDIEKNRDKILKIKHRFIKFDSQLISEKDNSIALYTTIWGAKESLFKIYPFGGLTFKDDIFIEPFELENNQTIGYIKKPNWETPFNIRFKQIENYSLVYATQKKN